MPRDALLCVLLASTAEAFVATRGSIGSMQRAGVAGSIAAVQMGVQVKTLVPGDGAKPKKYIKQRNLLFCVWLYVLY